MRSTVVRDTNTGMDDPSTDRILELLAAHDQLPLGTIADELDRHPVTVDRQCYDLQTDGYVRIAGSGSAYVLTDAGRNRVADEADPS
jgi:predicted ArsR family transcriptional regulator